MSHNWVSLGSTEEWALHLACFVDCLCRLNSQHTVSPFTTVQSNYSLPLYSRVLAANLRSSPTAYVVAAVIGERLFQVSPELFCPKSAHKLFVGLIVLGTKWADDKCYKTPQFASVCGISPKLLNTLEKHILVAVGFGVFVSESEFEHGSRRLAGLRHATPAWRTENLPPEAMGPVMRVTPPPSKSSKQRPRSAADISNIVRTTQVSASSAEEIPLKRPVSRARWTHEEDLRLLECVVRYGESWQAVSEELGSRDAKSCKARWRNKVNPEINHQPFSAAEDSQLIALVAQNGNRWATIALQFDGRTAMQCTNRFSLLKRQGRVSPTPHSHSQVLVSAV